MYLWIRIKLSVNLKKTSHDRFYIERNHKSIFRTDLEKKKRQSL